MRDNWAFLNLCLHFIKAMPLFRHQIDSECSYDIKYICSPSSFKKGEAGDSKTILHVDSNRWYEAFLEDNK
jgi:hypothetical protein